MRVHALSQDIVTNNPGLTGVNKCHGNWLCCRETPGDMRSEVDKWRSGEGRERGRMEKETGKKTVQRLQGRCSVVCVVLCSLRPRHSAHGESTVSR